MACLWQIWMSLLFAADANFDDKDSYFDEDRLELVTRSYLQKMSPRIRYCAHHELQATVPGAEVAVRHCHLQTPTLILRWAPPEMAFLSSTNIVDRDSNKKDHDPELRTQHRGRTHGR